MKLITLNIWGGHVRKPLLEFISRHPEVDVFCMQEVYHRAPSKVSTEDRTVSLNIFSEMGQLLPNHRALFFPTVREIYGLGMFIKNDVEVLGDGAIKIHDNPDYPGSGPTHSRYLQWAKCRQGTQTTTVMNVHGLWNGQGKSDSPARIDQAKRIRDAVDSFDSATVLCGDFNLRPDTESMKIIEVGMRNLNREYSIASTRTALYPKDEKFADYVLTSPDLKIHQFEVLPDEVSDHAPLYLNFTL